MKIMDAEYYKFLLDEREMFLKSDENRPIESDQEELDQIQRLKKELLKS